MFAQSPHLASFLGVTLLASFACSGGSGEPGDVIDAGPFVTIDSAIVAPDAVPASTAQGMDLLFVIDNSNSMREEQASLVANFSRFVNVLQNVDGGLPDVHIGVVTTNVGAGSFGIAGCEGNGDNGLLINNPSGACNAPSDRYIIDVASADGTTRERNYEGSLSEVFSCIAEVGVDGCGFEQPLEAMRRALDGSNVQNNGFLRAEALLAVVIISDEDDCSATDTRIYNTDQAQDRIDSELGFLSSFRCFEFGVSCNPDTPRVAGARSDCDARADSQFMDDVAEYADFLKGLKTNPGNVVVAGIIGDTSPVSVSLSEDGRPTLDPSCSSFGGQAVPAIRLNAFLEHFPARNTVTTICNDDLSDGLTGIANLLASLIGG
tara:strand:- start:25187 stop:26317 length:1131 start_codon:yes stop_codon:yes gene_type:complete